MTRKNVTITDHIQDIAAELGTQSLTDDQKSRLEEMYSEMEDMIGEHLDDPEDDNV